jgi:hypothetical protein
LVSPLDGRVSESWSCPVFQIFAHLSRATQLSNKP